MQRTTRQLRRHRLSLAHDTFVLMDPEHRGYVTRHTFVDKFYSAAQKVSRTRTCMRVRGFLFWLSAVSSLHASCFTPSSIFFLIHRSHSISFTKAQGIPKYKIGFGREKLPCIPTAHS